MRGQAKHGFGLVSKSCSRLLLHAIRRNDNQLHRPKTSKCHSSPTFLLRTSCRIGVHQKCTQALFIKHSGPWYVLHRAKLAAAGTLVACPIVHPTGPSTRHINTNSILPQQYSTIHAIEFKISARKYSTLANYVVTLDHIACALQQLGAATSSATNRSQNSGNPHNKKKAQLTSFSFGLYFRQLLVAVALCGSTTQMTAQVLLCYRKSSANTAANHKNSNLAPTSFKQTKKKRTC